MSDDVFADVSIVVTPFQKLLDDAPCTSRFRRACPEPSPSATVFPGQYPDDLAWHINGDEISSFQFCASAAPKARRVTFAPPLISPNSIVGTAISTYTPTAGLVVVQFAASKAAARAVDG